MRWLKSLKHPERLSVEMKFKLGTFNVYRLLEALSFLVVLDQLSITVHTEVLIRMMCFWISCFEAEDSILRLVRRDTGYFTLN